MLTSDATVSMSWVNTLLLAAERLGLPRERLLQRAGVRTELRADVRLPIDDITRLWRAAAELTGDPGFGLKAGRLVGPGSFNVVSFILLASPTLRAAVAEVQKFQRLISDGGRFQLVAGETHSWLIYHPQQGDLAFSPHQIEAVLAAVVSVFRWITARAVQPVAVQFSHARLAPLADYQAVFGPQVEFAQAFNGVQLDNRTLDQPLQSADVQLATLHREYAMAQLAALSQTNDLGEQLRAWLLARLNTGLPDAAAAARHLGLSERVLARRLQAKGTHYKALVDALRHERACDQVAHSSASFASIARDLGFSEASAFNRAFRRWTGQSPGQWRAKYHLAIPEGGPKPTVT